MPGKCETAFQLLHCRLESGEASSVVRFGDTARTTSILSIPERLRQLMFSPTTAGLREGRSRGPVVEEAADQRVDARRANNGSAKWVMVGSRSQFSWTPSMKE